MADRPSGALLLARQIHYQNRVFWRPCRLATALARNPTWTDAFLFALVDAVGYAPAVLAAAVPNPLTPKQIARLSAELRASHPDVVDLAATVSRLASRTAMAPH